ncbi:MAG: SPOR domain-containing protein [Paraclostridium sp.]
MAVGITKGICKHLNIKYTPTVEKPIEKPPITDSKTFYRVVCGSFNNKVYAEERVEELKELGIKDAFIAVYNENE